MPITKNYKTSFKGRLVKTLLKNIINMSKNIKILIPILILVVVAVVLIVYNILGKPLLTPVSGLRGTWKSSLPGKGMQVSGESKIGPATTKIYEAGDMELIIDSVKSNTASGKIRLTNFCVSGEAIAAGTTIAIPEQCVEDSGYVPIVMQVSGNALDFGTAEIEGVKTSMQGSYTADTMTGTMTITNPAFGDLKGEFNLSRTK